MMSSRIGARAAVNFSRIRCSADTLLPRVHVKDVVARAGNENGALMPSGHNCNSEEDRNRAALYHGSSATILSPAMKLDSKYFDSIRVSRRGSGQSAKRETVTPQCMWKGCEKPGGHKAPMGRGREGEYYHFCIEHVRQYNQSYNYFDGMTDAEVDNFRKDSITGHRPTWKAGANAWAHGTRDGARTAEAAERVAASAARTQGRRARSSRSESFAYQRQLKPLEKKALKALDLADSASKEEVKARFKHLVKIHHPDANGGDHRSEEKLREIIQAYNFLKQAGLAL
jgi:hypothetical protein